MTAYSRVSNNARGLTLPPNPVVPNPVVALVPNPPKPLLAVVVVVVANPKPPKPLVAEAVVVAKPPKPFGVAEPNPPEKRELVPPTLKILDAVVFAVNPNPTEFMLQKL